MDSLVFYERLWETATFDKYKLQQLEVIKELIPESVKSILDVGCGDGFITNAISKKYGNVVGADRSVVGLAKVKSPKVSLSVNSLSFRSGSFDLVIAIEVLEHLTKDVFEKTLKEIKWVSSRFILISVPYKESLLKRMVKCKNCNTVFHAYLHQRTFNDCDMENLFTDDFDMLYKRYAGICEINIPNKLYRLNQVLFGNYWHRDDLLCPKCETNIVFKTRTILQSLLNKVITNLGRYFLQERPYWVLSLYEKR